MRFDSLEFRQLLGRFMAVCQAVAYAHSRGVLHRDIKPANIMLGTFGETLVVDWGLAKVVGGAAGGAEGSLQPSGVVSSATLGAVGTPVYMSPEQAAGKVDELGPATDVYSLGATLYDLLTNRAPFEGNVREVLLQVERGSWVASRQVNGAVPAALDAICCKAMALDVEARYGSALELAREVERWLADEPVGAYREPWGTRARRWARKHPRRITGVLVLLVTAVVGLTVGAVLLDRSKREADESYQMAKYGVNHFLREVSEDVLMDEPGMQLLRYNLLTEALSYHEGFLQKRPDDPEIRQQLAETFRLRGELDSERGRLEQGKARAARAIALFEDLLRTKPDDKEYRFGLARSWLALAELQAKCGELEASQQTSGRSIALLSPLRMEHPGNTIVLNLLSRSHDLRATAEAQAGNIEEAIGDNRQALDFLEQAVGQIFRVGAKVEHMGGVDLAFNPEPGFWRPRINVMRNSRADRPVSDNLLTIGPEAWSNYRQLARTLTNQGMLLKTSGRLAESLTVFRMAIILWEWMSEQMPYAGRLRSGLSLALLNAGHVEVELGRPAKGEPGLQQALRILEKLQEAAPLDPEYQSSLLRAKGYLGEDFFVRGRTDHAVNLLHEAIQMGEALPKPWDNDRLLRTDRARFLYVLGCVEAERGHFTPALRSLREAEQQQGQMLAKAPADYSLRGDLLRTRERISHVRFQKDEVHLAERILEQRRILHQRQNLARQASFSFRLQGEAQATAAALAGLLLRAGSAPEALRIIEQALLAHEKLLQADQRRYKEELQVVEEVQEPRQVRAAGDRSSSGNMFHLTYMVAGLKRPQVSPSHELRRQWADLLACQATALAAIGQDVAARKALARAIAITEEISRREDRPFYLPSSWPSLWLWVAQELGQQAPESCHCYDLACHLALSSSFPDAAGIRDPAGRAVQALGELVAAGFDNPHKPRNDPRLASLHGRKEFQDLLRVLQVPLADRPGVRAKR